MTGSPRLLPGALIGMGVLFLLAAGPAARAAGSCGYANGAGFELRTNGEQFSGHLYSVFPTGISCSFALPWVVRLTKESPGCCSRMANTSCGAREAGAAKERPSSPLPTGRRPSAAPVGPRRARRPAKSSLADRRGAHQPVAGARGDGGRVDVAAHGRVLNRSATEPVGDQRQPSAWRAGALSVQVSVYSGPEPPSGGVRRPPLALIAPHCTQFDGVTSTSTMPSSPRAGLVHRSGAEPRPELAELGGDAPGQADVARLVVAGAVAREEDRRELVEAERPVEPRRRRRLTR